MHFCDKYCKHSNQPIIALDLTVIHL